MLALVLVLSWLATGCTVVVGGQSGPLVRPVGNPTVGPGVPIAEVVGATDAPVDKLAVAAVSEVLAYWRRAFPEISGQGWAELQGGFYSVDTTKPEAPPPPCTQSLRDVVEQAYYCPGRDVIAWDSGQLIPTMQANFGDTAVVVVLAHEIGHSVQNRLGLDVAQRREPQRYPTVLLEVMADCFAGAAIRDIMDRGGIGLGIDRKQLDDALRALITFRDPVGSGADDPRAHGNAFDRVSAFQDGFGRGAGLCAAMTVENRVFTQTQFGSAEDAAREGNLPLPDLLNSLSRDVQQRFGALVTSMGGSYPPVTVADAASTSCPSADADRQGPVRFCPDDRSIAIDSAELEKLHVLGDFASGALVTSRYALGVLAALNKPTEGTEAGRQALCLTGAYAAQLFNAGSRGEFQLSPGDLDEAVTVLLATDFAARDVHGQANSEAGFERVGHFRTGALEGVGGCRL